MTEPLTVLRRLRETPVRPPPVAVERCELCGEEIPDEHGHLVDLEARSLLCACRGCRLLFESRGAGGGHFRAVPDRYVALAGLALSPAQWDALEIPVSVAFFFINSKLDRVAAFYPGPAGATESLLPLDAWRDLVDPTPDLGTLEPDVEAFLVRAERQQRGAVEGYIVPIDACYELVGQLRKVWQGFDGGRDAHEALDRFFDRVRDRAG